MKRPYIFVGFLGYLAILFGCGLFCQKVYSLAVFVFITGIALIDWNRRGQ